uniref:Uncharacterized protein n=1 Tax=Heterorhabditis bacteriophora TaxID=37862 RepID=A0A1I7XUK3_HETBA
MNSSVLDDGPIIRLSITSTTIRESSKLGRSTRPDSATVFMDIFFNIKVWIERTSIDDSCHIVPVL